MLSLRTSIVLFALLASAALAVSTEGLLLAKRGRDPTYPACDTKQNNPATRQGAGVNWQKSDDPNFYVAPGTGSCGLPYTDNSNIVCVNPGWINSANVNKCNTWVEVELNGVVGSGRVLDTCGAVAGSTFGCNDIYLGKQLFETLAGNGAKAALAAGRLPGQVKWRFTPEPCFACLAGLPGKNLDGSNDSCTGKDARGALRCGRKSGNQRLTGKAANDMCQASKTTCPK